VLEEVCVLELTYLMPDHIGQCANELWGGVAVTLEGLLVDYLADGEPEGCLEALCGMLASKCSY
jgi:hypothetical protein